MSPEEFERFKTIRLADSSRKTLANLEIDLRGLAPFMLKPELYEKCGKTWNRPPLRVELGSFPKKTVNPSKSKGKLHENVDLPFVGPAGSESHVLQNAAA